MPDLRMPNINSVTITGRLCRDPEMRHTPSGLAVTKLVVAVDGAWKDGKATDTMFLACTAWDKTATWCTDNLAKGDPVLVEGRLKQDEWEDKATGAKRTAINLTIRRIQILVWKDKGKKPTANTPKSEPTPQTEDEVLF